MKTNFTKWAVVDIQKMLDDHINLIYPAYGVVRYVPQGESVEQVMPEATHELTLTSRETQDELVFAIRAHAPYDRLVNMLLSIF